MKYHLLTTALLILALALYAVGATAGSTFVLALGAAAEVLFWVRVLRRPRHSSSKLAAGKR
jgi:hypothetical protein